MTLKAVAGNPALNAAGVVSVNNLGTSIANAAATLLPKWRFALQKVRQNTANARILCVGDSITWGFGGAEQQASNQPNIGAWPSRLAQLLNSTLTPFVQGLGVPQSNLLSTTDARWTVGSGWTTSSFGAAGNASWKGTGTTGNLVYTPGVNCDSFYVYYTVFPGNGSNLVATGTGGTPTSISTAGGAPGNARTLITAASASTSNTLTLTSTTNTNFVTGVEPLLSTQSQVLVGNAGVGSATAGNWANTADVRNGSTFIEIVAPDLTIIALGVNDAGTNNTSPATFSGYVQALITAAKVSGDVILMDFPPSELGQSQDKYYNNEATYVPALQALAASNNIPYLSIWQRSGAAFNTNLMFNLLHPNDYGYWDWAESVAAFLNSF